MSTRQTLGMVYASRGFQGTDGVEKNQTCNVGFNQKVWTGEKRFETIFLLILNTGGLFRRTILLWHVLIHLIDKGYFY